MQCISTEHPTIQLMPVTLHAYVTPALHLQQNLSLVLFGSSNLWSTAGFDVLSAFLMRFAQ